MRNGSIALLKMLYLIMGIVQFFAILSFFTGDLAWPLLFAIPAALIAAYIPIIGPICGYIGATTIWGWAWWTAGLLFFGWIVLFFILFIFNAIFSSDTP